MRGVIGHAIAQRVGEPYGTYGQPLTDECHQDDCQLLLRTQTKNPLARSTPAPSFPPSQMNTKTNIVNKSRVTKKVIVKSVFEKEY